MEGKLICHLVCTPRLSEEMMELKVYVFFFIPNVPTAVTEIDLAIPRTVTSSLPETDDEVEFDQRDNEKMCYQR